MLRDRLAQRNDFLVVIARDIVGASVGLIGVARIGADIHSLVDEKINSAQIALFGKPRFGLAKIVNWDLEADFVAVARRLLDLGRFTFHERRTRCERVIRVGHSTVRVTTERANLKHVDVAGGTGEAIFLRQNHEIHACNLKIDAARDGLGFDRIGGARLGRQFGKPVGKPVFQLAAPQAQYAIELFPLATLPQSRRGQLTAYLGVEGVLTSLVELRHGTGLAQLLRKF